MRTIGDALLQAEANGRLVLHLAEGSLELGTDELQTRAEAAARALQARGIEPGSHVGLFGPNRPEWVVWAYGVWLAGGVLVPIQVPLRAPDLDAFRERVLRTVTAGRCALVVADPALLALVDGAPVLAWDAPVGTGSGSLPVVDGEAAAVVQFTSGSTAEPKGVILSHRAVLAQMGVLGHEGIRDEIVSGWAPFFHDLGLFYYVVYPFVRGLTSQVLATELFAKDPATWLRLITQTRSTVALAPQSAWSAAFVAARRSPSEIDLSSLDLAWFAAEGIDPAFVARMTTLAPQHRLRLEALGTTYGLAEAVLGVTSTHRLAGVTVHEFDRLGLAEAGVARPTPGGQSIVSSGVPMHGMQVRIAHNGQAAGENRVGAIEVAGASLTSGYLDGSTPVRDGWLATGDLGFLHDGELFVTGRAKDVVIVMGANYHPEDFEWAAQRVEGVRPGRVVAFSDASSKHAVVVCEARDARPGLGQAVSDAVQNALGLAPHKVLVVPPGTIEKTTSGKLRRSTARERYLQGELQQLAARPS